MGIPFTYAKLARLFDLTDKTIKEYIRALMDANLLFELDHFSFSLKKQIRTPKKIYSIDPGLVNAVAFKFSENLGRLFENAIYLALKQTNSEIYYYKTQQDYEVDFVIKQGKTLTLVQVCLELGQETTSLRAIRSSSHAAKELGLKSGTIVTANEEKDFTVDSISINAIPLYKFILSLKPKLQT